MSYSVTHWDQGLLERCAVKVSDDVSGTAEAFARLALELHAERGVSETVEALLHFALQAFGCCQAGLVRVEGTDTLEIAEATDPLLDAADLHRLGRAAASALAAHVDGHDLILVSDTAVDERWPAWTSSAAEVGLRSMLAVRLHAGGESLGVLQLFSRKPFGFETDDVEVAHLLARHASVAVASAQQEASLWRAIDARKAIGQAQGILMERLGIDADQAFAVLRRYSQDNNIKLREVARQLTETREFPVDAPGRSRRRHREATSRIQ
jgi:GAF domain-containing protein